ncbi:glutathione S-transferase-like [Bombus pascuorum]|uniref:glutathione S-transferase-like n=1 Tax=Bombus pascuorum TaxID=65598 RepID=UPI00213C0069|nr:glutathione S-transferase-like [Bombus pascuorum]
MPVYKLTYFPAKALGEPIRFLFNYAGTPFEDERISKDVWPEIKPLTPYGQIPMLVIDGKKVAQSTAICRYLAKQYGLAGKNDLDALYIDATVDTIHDIRHKLASFHYEEDEKVKARKRKAAEEILPFVLERLDQQVKENDGYFHNGTLSWADLTFVALLDYLNFMYKSDLIANYENLKLLEEKVLLLPNIKKWIETRPVSEC